MTEDPLKETQLVWPSKDVRAAEQIELPFQIVETINESRATRQARRRGKQLTLYDMWSRKEGDTFEEGWRNKLIWGENKLVMSSLSNEFAGRINLIYIDPPFATGADFSFINQIGETGLEFVKGQSMIEEKAYRDTWGQGLSSYLQMMYDRLVLMRELLVEEGSIFVHLDYHVGHYVKAIMDEIFGRDNFRNEIIVKRGRKKSLMKQFDRVSQMHVSYDTLLWYSKGKDTKFPHPIDKEGSVSSQWMGFWSNVNRPTMRYELLGVTPSRGQWKWEKKRAYAAVENYRKYSEKHADKMSLEEYWNSTERKLEFVRKRPTTKYAEYWIPPKDFVYLDNIWLDIEAYNYTTGFATEKHEQLLERVIENFSDEEDIVADFFCGSGTTLAVAEKLNRRWIGCDLSRWAIHISRKRLLEIQDCRPFDLLNLGKYERKYWQAITFGKKRKQDDQLVIFEYLKFILELYGAGPLSGMQHLHGRKGKAVIHVGAVDAPVTIDEINACLDECAAINQKELYILGWEWEMGLYDVITEAAKGRGIKLVLLNIPHEVMEKQAVERGDVQFYELAYLDVDIIQKENRKVIVKIKDFVIPNYELLPEEIRKKVKKWSDYIDYWAIDWDFRNDTFMNGWVTYRTRRDRKLILKSDAHNYKQPGKYTIMVKVVDVFGNDTSKAFEIQVR